MLLLLLLFPKTAVIGFAIVVFVVVAVVVEVVAVVVVVVAVVVFVFVVEAPICYLKRRLTS